LRRDSIIFLHPCPSWRKDTAAGFAGLHCTKDGQTPLHFIGLADISQGFSPAGSERAFSFVSGELFQLSKLFIPSSQTTWDLE